MNTTTTMDPMEIIRKNNVRRVNALTAGSVVLTCFVAVQLSMVIFILSRRRKDNALRQAFYTLFVAVTIVDCAFVVSRRALDYVFLAPSFDSLELSTLVLTFLCSSAATFQALIHALIAFNRMTAFYSPLRHTTLWSSRAARWAVLLVAVVAVLLSTCGYVYSGLTVKCDQCYGIVLVVVFISNGGLANSAITAAIFIACCSISFTLCTFTIAKLRKLSKYGKMGALGIRQDLRLFAHSTFMLLIQCLLAFHYFVESMDYYRDVLTKTGSEGYHRFSIDFLGGGGPCYAALMNGETGGCGLVYIVLEKYLDKSLTERLFCLSGAAFLLLVSDHVRPAYFRFYFGFVLRRSGNVNNVICVKGATTDCSRKFTGVNHAP